MATFKELTTNYGIAYAFWAFIEYHTDSWSWLGELAQRQMNRISMKKTGKEVFALSSPHPKKEEVG